MWIDPIVEEVRKNREEFAAQFNSDLRAMGKALQEIEKASGRRVVSFAHEPAVGIPGKLSDTILRGEPRG
ncbi:MAG: hypothetical protein HQL87_10650 [Magnetococcales bacterium]|nr:hypothetical protein [Magnetococcales bacterium]